ncbi:MAG: hypothetical protein MJZ64_02065 [Paludibacteraceae bacterium]|nr:hypothetical protein [Paludibacteraceae bacterium]
MKNKREICLFLMIFLGSALYSNAQQFVFLPPTSFDKNEVAQVPSKSDLDRFFYNIASMWQKEISSNALTGDAFWNAVKNVLLVFSNSNVSNHNIITNTERLSRKTIYGVTKNAVEQIVVSYMSQTPHGDSIQLSGKIILPKYGCNNQIILAHHYTIGSTQEAPSQSYAIEEIFATKGYIVIMPDYLGYGVSEKYIHPYLAKTYTAKTAVDLLLAVIPYLQNRGISIQYDKLILTGYSQGASAALATQQLLEQCYADIFQIEHVYIGAGAYDPAATYDYYLQSDKTHFPCVIPMLFIGMDYYEKLNLDFSQIFLPKLLDYYEEGILSKRNGINEINYAIDEKYISSLVTTLARDKTKYPTSLFYKKLQENSVTNIHPQAPIYMFHSIEDDVVPFINSTLLKDSLEKKHIPNIQYDFGKYGSHINAGVLFFRKIYNFL